MEGESAKGSEVVAALFTDLVGSTELSSRLDQHQADVFRRAHFSLLRRAIAASGGREVKNLGDGLMVVFPTPSAGIACAVAMQQLVEENNRTSAEEVGLRVGLSGGEVVHEDGDYFGDPVVEAARLCATAQGGQILVSGVIRAMAGRRTASPLRDLGPLPLKGLPTPVQTFEVRWEPLPDTTGAGGPVPLPSRLALIPTTGVIGRTFEAEQMTVDLERVGDGNGRALVLVAGEPGVGKTTLAAQLARRAFDAGALVLLGRCDEDLVVPYGPFAEALHHYVASGPEETLRAHVREHGATLAALVPSLRTRLGELPGHQSGAQATAPCTDFEVQQHLLFRAVVDLLVRAGADQLVVLVLDDLQWADPASLQLLRRIAGSDELRRLLIVGTYRSSELTSDHPLYDALVALRRELPVEEIELEGLGTAEVVTFVEAVVGHALSDSEVALADALSQETDGNPFFLGEVLRHLDETGAVTAGLPQHSTEEQLGSLQLPESVRQVIISRVHNLGDSAREVLPMAAVVGREFDLHLLEVLSQKTEGELLDVLEAAGGAALVDESPQIPGRYRFAHALVQHALSQHLGVTRRARVHRQIAEVLSAWPASESNVFEVARHWQMGARPSDVGPVVRACVAAGRRAVELSAFVDAVSWFAAAVKRGDSLVSVERADLLAALGRAQIQADLLEEGRAALREAASLYTDDKDAEALAEIALAYHGPMRVTNRDRAEKELLERALAALGPEVPSELRARLLAHLTSFCYDDTAPEKLELAEQAIALTAGSRDARSVFEANRALFWPQFGRASGAAAACTAALHALSAAEETLDLQACIEGNWMAFLALVQLADWDTARRHLASLDDLAERSGLPAEQALTESIRQRMLVSVGRFAEAEERANSGLASGPVSDSALMGYGTLITEIRRWCGPIEEGLALLDPSAFQPTPQVANLVAVARAALLSESDQADDRRHEIEAMSHASLANLTGEGSWTHALEIAGLGDVACAQGDRELGSTVLGRLSPWEGMFLQVSLIIDWGPVNLYLGKIESLLGRHDDAVAHLEDALRATRAAELTIWEALAQAELSRALRGRGAVTDIVRSEELAGQALSTSRRLGLRRVERRLP